jgi:uncharacterized RDD family membrane protein YckC
VNGTPAYDLASVSPANFGRRFGALLIDWALCLIISAFYADPRIVAWPSTVLMVIVNTVGIGLFGRTPGMTLAGLRCISVLDGGAIGLPKALLRGVLLILIVPAVIMGRDRRGLHDRAAGSWVIEKPRTGKTV